MEYFDTDVNNTHKQVILQVIDYFDTVVNNTHKQVMQLMTYHGIIAAVVNHTHKLLMKLMTDNH
jgi:hypothetical protein